MAEYVLIDGHLRGFRASMRRRRDVDDAVAELEDQSDRRSLERGGARMTGDTVFETYDGLWGELMFVMHDPDHLWATNEGRADWFESLGLGTGLQVLDLGCGNGYLDVVLGRRGHEVVGVDRVGAVIEAARQLVEHESVEFVGSDLRDLHFEPARFDVVLMFGVVGLMSRRDDTSVVERVASWLRPGGSLLVDCDLELARTETTEMAHPDGVVRWNWSSDPKTRTNRLEPRLHRDDGTVVELRDPIDPERGSHTGLHRYIYPEKELTEVLKRAEFEVSRIGHYVQHVFPGSEPEAYMLRALANPS